MIALLLALTAALGWGASDYFGGDASRRGGSVFVVIAVSELAGGLLLLPTLLVRGVPDPSLHLVWAVVAGTAVTVELSLIYRALADGFAFITAPVGALGSAIAVLAGLIGGDPLPPLTAVGIVLALLGAGGSAWQTPAGRRRASMRRALAVCVGAASAVGITLASLHAAGQTDPFWAAAVEHAATCVTSAAVGILLWRRSPTTLMPTRPQLPALGIITLAGVGGDLAFAGAAGQGQLSLTSAISSLYPVMTIGLGWGLAGRQPSRFQATGVILALAGTALLGATAG